MKRAGLYLFILLQTLILLGLAGSAYATNWFGQEIKLRTVPVDPRDIFYGDYVTLSYSMSRLDASLWQGTGGLPESGDPVYTRLVPKGEFYEPAAAYPERVDVDSGEILLKGRVLYAWEREINVTYGLERYYVPENTGKELEDISDRLIVHVKVAPWGQHQIVGVDMLELDENQ